MVYLMLIYFFLYLPEIVCLQQLL